MGELRFRPTAKQMAKLHATARDGNLTHTEIKEYIKTRWNASSIYDLSQEQFQELLTSCEAARVIARTVAGRNA